MDKKTLRDVITAIQNQPKANFKSMTNKELIRFKFAELSKEDYKRLTAELKKRKLI